MLNKKLLVTLTALASLAAPYVAQAAVSSNSDVQAAFGSVDRDTLMKTLKETFIAASADLRNAPAQLRAQGATITPEAELAFTQASERVRETADAPDLDERVARAVKSGGIAVVHVAKFAARAAGDILVVAPATFAYDFITTALTGKRVTSIHDPLTRAKHRDEAVGDKENVAGNVTAAAAVGAELTFAINPAAVVLSGLAGTAVGASCQGSEDAFCRSVSTMDNGIGNFAGELGAAAGEVVHTVGEGVFFAARTVGKGAVFVARQVGGALVFAGKAVGTVAIKVGEGFVKVAQFTGRTAYKVVRGAGRIAYDGIMAVGYVAGEAAEAIVNGVKATGKFVGYAANGLYRSAKATVKGIEHVVEFSALVVFAGLQFAGKEIMSGLKATGMFVSREGYYVYKDAKYGVNAVLNVVHHVGHWLGRMFPTDNGGESEEAPCSSFSSGTTFGQIAYGCAN